jgi:hypothetical protein
MNYESVMGQRGGGRFGTRDYSMGIFASMITSLFRMEADPLTLKRAATWASLDDTCGSESIRSDEGNGGPAWLDLVDATR